MSRQKTVIGRVVSSSDREVLVRLQGGRMAAFPLARVELAPMVNPLSLETMPGHFTISTDEATAKECGLEE